ncbi:S-layer homology domain-containing protein [Sporosarcina sp. P7]|uniref:S-layer homology domain-containing protein n=1 Tax=Sporosarcina sp. P7 TaxID=2048244 RepID=UPI000C165B96|nr:S-layer homology domain-containing protein [Sporosarcina sp. P7]PID23877.1 S-layer protein [Sporosarcina sp. P7]
MANQPTKYRKFVVGAASAALVASAVAPVAMAATFTDVKDNNSHKEAIDALSNAGVISGYEDGTFKPNKTLTRSDVVKLMGKWLVSEGYKVPTDYKTKPRFSDLKTTSNDELLQMSALVYDNGVFVGKPDGSLDPAGDITRENMAIVLVRAFDRVHDVDLTSYVKDQDFKKDVTDLGKAKAEARPAIDVLDFFDITNPAAPEFNPKSTTTRGQFASFLYKTTLVDFGQIGGGVVAPGVASVKGINATTVEVTMKDKVENINSLNFSIDGLTVANAAVKQTDDKTVVLTTAVQKGGEKYTVTLNDKAIGSFTGVSAVVPEKISLTQKSLQGKVGQQVILSADIGVKEAGVPVTFNVSAGTDTTLNPQMAGEAVTNADGIATYSYTRYAGTTDTVTAYPTGAPNVRSSAKVYWDSSITVTEETIGNVLANGSKKVYKIKTDTWNTEGTGAAAYNYVNVAFAENVDVSPDKLVRGASVIDTGVSTNALYPSQVTTGGVQEVRVKVDAKGEATFTVTGNNASVTPVVFVDKWTNSADRGKWNADELQAVAPTVKFELNHTLGLTVKAEGVQNAAARNADGIGEGGRKYTVTVTDKDGKIAPAGTKAYVTFEEGNYSTDKLAYIKGANNSLVTANKAARYEIEVTDNKGEATFTIVGDRDAFAAPTVYLENGKEFGLDKADLQTVGEMTYFVNAVFNNAELKVVNDDNKEVTTLPSTQKAYFNYNSVDQNGFDYYKGTGAYEVSYEVTANFANVIVSGNGLAPKTVKAGTTETVKVNAIAGKAVLIVDSANVASNVTVNASASQVSLPNKTASIAFTKGSQVPAVYTGQVDNINTVDNKLKFVGYDAITYSTASFKNENGVVIDEAAFESKVNSALSAGDIVKVTATKNADNTYTLEIETITSAPSAAEGKLVSATVTDEVADAAGLVDTITFTFDKDVDASTLATSDFNISGGFTLAGSPTVSGKTVKYTLTSAVTEATATAETITTNADQIGFTDGSGNALVTALPVKAGQKVSKLNTVTPNTELVTGVNAVAPTVTIDGTTLDISVLAANSAADFNGLKFNFAQNPANTLSVTYNAGVVSVLLPNTSPTNSSAIDTALDTLGVAGVVTFNGKSIDLKDIVIAAAGTDSLTGAVITPTSTTLDNGVTGIPAQAGQYKFTLYPTLITGDKVTVNNITYTKVVSGAAVPANKTFNTATDLVNAIKANDSRFAATSAASTNTITLDDANTDGASAPVISVN